jgi:hypothetical protein
MRRVLAAVAALLLLSLPATALAQSAAPSAPTSFQVAPGVTAVVTASMQDGSPAIFQLRFDPGSSFDLRGGPTISLVTIDWGALQGTTTVPLTVYDASGATTTAPANTADTFSAGEYFLVPPNAPGHVENHGTSEAAMSITSLPVPAAAGPGASASPNG